MTRFDDLIVDADNHYYEATDAFTRYGDPALGSKRVRWAEIEGKRRLMVGDRLYRFIANPSFDPVAKPGVLTEMFRSLHEGREIIDSASWGELEPINPEYRDRHARLARMDAQGVEAALLLPTLGITVEHLMGDDVEMTYGNLHAFNQWLEEDWGFNYRNRIFATPLLSLLDVERAVEELEWVLAHGARVIHMRPGPAHGRSPADPMFDPFWARIDEAGVVVVFHACEAGYNEYFSTNWGEPANPAADRMTPFQWVTSFGDRPVFDTMAALVLHGLFTRFPNVRVASIEMGSLWVPYLLDWLDKAAGLGRRVALDLGDLPSEIFRRHVSVSPFPEEDIPALTELIGAERVLLGSDWPHAEGLAEPREYLDGLKGLDDREIHLIARDNTRRLVGIG